VLAAVATASVASSSASAMMRSTRFGHSIAGLGDGERPFVRSVRGDPSIVSYRSSREPVRDRSKFHELTNHLSVSEGVGYADISATPHSVCCQRRPVLIPWIMRWSR
jgi:hypothetical protein